MALLSSTTGSLTGAMTGPILNWDPVPGLKYDKKRTDEGIKLNQFKTLTGQLLSTCTQKNGGGLLKAGTMKKKENVRQLSSFWQYVDEDDDNESLRNCLRSSRPKVENTQRLWMHSDYENT